MLPTQKTDDFELSVDVSDETAVDNAKTAITKHTNNDSIEQIITYMFKLSQSAYKTKTGLKKGDTVDIIVSENKLSLKDMGADYRSVDNGYIEKIRKLTEIYENTLMIGMNYSTVILKG